MSGITPGKTYNAAIASVGRMDAFHAPCILCRCDPSSKYHVDPGDKVKVLFPANAFYVDGDNWDGIADPFADEIRREDLFWVFLRPELVKGLTHTFTFVPSEQMPDEEEEADDGEFENDGCGRGCR